MSLTIAAPAIYFPRMMQHAVFGEMQQACDNALQVDFFLRAYR